jgi:ABC-2 type transport system permease protein
MNSKMMLVARYEYWRHVARRGFLFAVLGMPTIFAVIIGALILFFTAKANDPVGVVDLSGRLLPPADYQPADGDSVPLVAYADADTAKAALEEGEIQAYFVVPADYPTTNQIPYYHVGDSYEGATSDFIEYLRASLLAESDPAVAQRFTTDPYSINFVSLSEEEGLDGPASFILPFAFGFVFVIGIFTTAGYLLQAIVDEKENRTMEILVTSLSPERLMIGKILGLVGVGLTQIAIWIAAGVIGYQIARANIATLPDITISPSNIAIAIAWFLPFYLLIACLMAAIGISVTATSEGQQASGILSILCFSPYYFFALFLQSPDSPLAVFLTLFPFSSAITLLMRWQLTEVPAWQLIASWLILAGTAAVALFLVSRLLHLGMLRYGQRLTLREITASFRRT